MARFALIDSKFNDVLREKYAPKKDEDTAPQDAEAEDDVEEPEDEEESVEVEDEDVEPDGDDVEPDEDEEVEDFDVSDHLDRITKLLELLLSDGGSGGGLLGRMLDPGLIGAMPFGDMVVGDDTAEGLDGIRGKVTMMTGEQHGDEPMEIEKKEIDLGDEDVECCEEGAKEAREAIADIHRIGNFRYASKSESDPDFRRNLRRAHEMALSIREASDITPAVVAAIARRVNPVRFAAKLDRPTRQIISGVISDLSAYVESPAYFRSIAGRIKVAYQGLGEGDGMRRQAYTITREESAGQAGYNICPKFNSLRGPDAKVPIAWADCRDQCIEGKQEDDGSVSCKFANWLENVADSHVRAMGRLDEHKNPANKDMELRLADGEREHPRKRVLRSIEQRLSEDFARGRSWDGIKRAQSIDSGVSGRMMNTEALLEEVLKGGDVKRDDSGNFETMEAKLRAATGDRGGTDMIAEEKLNKKRDDSAHGEGATTEARMEDIHDEMSLKEVRLLDELIEQKYPRTDSELGSKGKD